jgi:hypothetical protein
MLWRLIEKIGCKCLILKTWGCRGGVSRLNGNGCSLWSGQKHHIHSSESAYPINQKLKKKMHRTLNRAILANPYRLGFFYLGPGIFQFDPCSSDFV